MLSNTPIRSYCSTYFGWNQELILILGAMVALLGCLVTCLKITLPDATERCLHNTKECYFAQLDPPNVSECGNSGISYNNSDNLLVVGFK